jgi:hypothetical protein
MTDTVTSVKWGGSSGTAMTDITNSPFFPSVSTETLGMHIFFLGSGIPTGAQAINVTVNALTTFVIGSITLTAASDTIVVAQATNEAASGTAIAVSIPIPAGSSTLSWTGNSSEDWEIFGCAVAEAADTNGVTSFKSGMMASGITLASNTNPDAGITEWYGAGFTPGGGSSFSGNIAFGYGTALVVGTDPTDPEIEALASSGSPVLWPYSQKGPRPTPPVYFAIDGIPVDVDDDWSLQCSAYGGYETGRFAISEAALRRHPTGITPGAPVTAWTNADFLVWEGVIPTAPDVSGGRATIATTGPWADAEAASEVLLYQVRGGKLWVEGDEDPHNYAQNDGFVLNGRAGKLQFRAPKGEDFVANQVASFVLWIPGAHFTRYSFVLNKNRDDANFGIRTRGALGPSGSLTTIDTIDLGASGPASGTEQEKIGLSGDYDLLLIQLLCDTDQANLSTRLRTWLTSIRVNDRTTLDDFSASDVMMDVGGQLGWNLNGVQSTSANVLPLLWTEPWSELMLYMADLEDNYVRRVASGLEFGPFGDQHWELLKTLNSTADLRSLEPFNRVVVRYETQAGAPAQVISDADPDPIPGRLRVMDYDLNDPQPNDTFATAVAERMVAHYSQPRWAVSIEVYQARHQAGPLAILPGAMADVTDWDLGISQPLRIHGVEWRSDRTRLSIESPISTVRLEEEARRGLGHPRRRGKNRRNR